MMKMPSLRAQLQQKQRQDLTKRCMKTLEQLMASLMLQEDYKVIQEAHKKALQAEENEKRVRVVSKAQLEEQEGNCEEWQQVRNQRRRHLHVHSLCLCTLVASS